MKKVLSAIMVISMLLCMIAIFPVSAAEADNTLSSETVALYVSDRVNTTDDTKKDVRIVLVANVEYLESLDALTLGVSFADAVGNAAGAISFDVFKDLTFMEKASAAGEIYVAAEGCAIFGVVIEGAPMAAFASVSATLTEGAEGEAVLNGEAALSTWLESSEEIVNAAYALENGASLEGTYTLSGTVTAINIPYDTYYQNLTVTIDVDGSDKTMYCFRLKGDGADQLAVGDKITVSGSFTNYNGTIEYKAGCTIDAWADTTVTVTEAAAIGAAKEHNTYTADKYTVTGVVTEIKNTTYGNLYIADEAGNTLYVYGIYSADGSTRFDAMNPQPKVGDTVTVLGVLGQYNGTAQMRDGWVTALVDGEVTEPEVPTPDSTLTASEASQLGASHAHNTYTTGKYYVTGVVTSIVNTTYGNLYITDAENNTLYVYGIYSADGSTRFDAMNPQPKVGDTVTVYGILGQYSGTAQMKNGWVTEFVPAEGEGEEGEVPAEPTGATSVSVTFSNAGYDNAADFSTYALDDVITLTGDKGSGSNAPKYYTSGSALRFYGKNTFTVSCADGYEITSIVITTVTGSNGISEATATPTNCTYTVSGTTVTVTPEDGTADVVLTNPNSSGNFRIAAITVTYTAIG